MMEAVLSCLKENWMFIVTAISAAVVAAFGLGAFLSLTRDEQIARIKEWLLYAVIEAEKNLGGGTGKLKLATVYDMFVKAFPMLKCFVTVETFSGWVDEVLVDMRRLIETNAQIESIVNSD